MNQEHAQGQFITDFLQLQMMTLTLETGFTKASISRLESRFRSLDKDNKGYLERRDLMCISEVSFIVNTWSIYILPVGINEGRALLHLRL